MKALRWDITTGAEFSCNEVSDYDADSELTQTSPADFGENEQGDDEAGRVVTIASNRPNFDHIHRRKRPLKRLARKVTHPSIDCSTIVQVGSSNFQQTPVRGDSSFWELSQTIRKSSMEIKHESYDGRLSQMGGWESAFQAFPRIPSPQPVALEEAIQLSLDARQVPEYCVHQINLKLILNQSFCRLLMEAELPRRVVHANAACSRLRKVLTESISSDFQGSNDGRKPFDDELRDQLALLQIYIHPVRGSEGREITHFLYWIKQSGRFLFRFSLSRGKRKSKQTVG